MGFAAGHTTRLNTRPGHTTRRKGMYQQRLTVRRLRLLGICIFGPMLASGMWNQGGDQYSNPRPELEKQETIAPTLSQEKDSPKKITQEIKIHMEKSSLCNKTNKKEETRWFRTVFSKITSKSWTLEKVGNISDSISVVANGWGTEGKKIKISLEEINKESMRRGPTCTLNFRLTTAFNRKNTSTR